MAAPQTHGRYRFVDLNARVNPHLDAADCCFVIALIGALVLAWYFPTDLALFQSSALSVIKRVKEFANYVFLLEFLTGRISSLRELAWVFPLVSVVLIVLTAFLIRMARDIHALVRTRTGNQCPPHLKPYRTTVSPRTRTALSILSIPDWLFIVGGIFVLGSIICSQIHYFGDGDIRELEIFGVPIMWHSIFRACRKNSGYVFAVIGGCAALIPIFGLVVEHVSTQQYADRVNRRIAGGALVGGAIGAYEESKQPSEDRRYLPAIATGAVVGAGSVAAVHVLAPVLAIIAVAGIGAGIGYGLGFHVLGPIVGMLAVVAMSAGILGVGFLVCVAYLWVLRTFWRTAWELCRWAFVTPAHPFVMSRTRLLMREDWAMLHQENGRWVPRWGTL